MEQETICINNIEIPTIILDNERYYPVSYLMSKVLEKKTTINNITKNNEFLNKYIKTLEINYDINNNNIQNTKCINEEGLKIILSKSKIGRLNTKQKENMNHLLKYFNVDLIDINDRFVYNIDMTEIEKYNEFEKDCIKEVLKNNEDIKWQKCTKCNNYYPYDSIFFYENKHSSYELNTICKVCNGHKSFIHPNSKLNYIYHTCGIDNYILYKENKNFEFFMNICKNYNSTIIEYIYENKDEIFKIIKILYDNNIINIDELSREYMLNNFKIDIRIYKISTNEILEYLFDNKPKEYPWLYKKYKLLNLDINKKIKIMNNYIELNNIVIKNIYNYNYSNLLEQCGLIHHINDMLSFIVFYYNYKYPAYKFKLRGENYWKSKENFKREIKYLIEEDMKLEINKIPLYLTLYTIQKKSRTLYNVLKNKKLYNNLYECINDIYPNKFIETDFDIGFIRKHFDSLEEEQIYNLLKDKFNNVIYNRRNTDDTIKFNGMIPDFIIITNNNLYIIEYFGLYVDNRKNNKRINEYIEKSNNKMIEYEKINFKKIFIFPKDLENDMSGLLEKIIEIN